MLRLTVRAEAGAGDALTVKAALPPSLTAGPAVMLTTGLGGGVMAAAVPLIKIRGFPASVASLQLPAPCRKCLLSPMLHPLAAPESSPLLFVVERLVASVPPLRSMTTA